MEPRAEIRRRTRLSPEARRDQLMECAVEVFSRRGIGRAGHAEIAEQAKVSVATVFNYFNTREDLVDEVLTEIEAFVQQILEQAYNGQGSARESIHRHVKLFVDAAYDKPDHASIWLEWSSSVREEVWPRYTRLLDKALERIAPPATGHRQRRDPERAVGAGSGPLPDRFWLCDDADDQSAAASEPGRGDDFLFKYVTAPIQAS